MTPRRAGGDDGLGSGWTCRVCHDGRIYAYAGLAEAALGARLHARGHDEPRT